MDKDKIEKPITESNPDGAGKPGWWETTPEKMDKLEYAFSIGCTDQEAALYADISMTQLYYYQRTHPDFAIRKEALKQKPFLKARETIFNNLDGIGTATWFMERKKKDEFAPKHEIETSTKLDDETVSKIDSLLSEDAETTPTPQQS